MNTTENGQSALGDTLVTTGTPVVVAGLTVSVATVVVVEPNAFVNTASYFVPDSATVVAPVDSVLDVAPLIGVNVAPPSVDSDHCTAGAAQFAGVEPAAVNVAAAGAVTVTPAGCVTIAGAAAHDGELTINVTAFVVVEPNAFVNTASNFVPDSATVVAPVDSVLDVAPLTAVNEPAPGASDCHCTDGAAQFAGVEPAAVNVAAAGAVTVTPAGCVTIAGAAAHDGGLTVNVTAFVVVEPNAFVNTASNFVPDSATVVAPVDSVVDVAPPIGVNEPAPGASDCHCTDGAAQFAGVEPAAVNVAAAGAVTVTPDGCVTIAGAAAHDGELTVNVTAFVVVEPNAFVNTASNFVPDSATVVAPVDSVLDVAPLIGVNVAPPSVDSDHCTAGAAQFAGVEPAAVNVAAAGAVTVTPAGCVTIAGAAAHDGELTINVTAFVVVEPNAFVNTASNFVPDSATVVAPVDSVLDVAPLTAVNEPAPGASDCHCTDGAAQFAGVEPAAVNVAAAGAVTVTPAGCVTIAGAAAHDGGLTVNVTAFVVVEPNAFVNTASNFVPDSATVVAPVDSVLDVAPLTAVNEPAPGASDCHCTDGAAQFAGVEPAAVNVAAAGAVTATLAGCVTIAGAAKHGGGLTVNVTAFVVVEPKAFVNTASYFVPDSPTVVAPVDSVVDVAPLTAVNVTPPSVDTDHCTDGAAQFAGVEPAAVNVAAAGAVTATLAGCVTIAGAAKHGGGLTVNVTAFVVVEPKAFVNTASYFVPDSPTVVAPVDSVVDVAPLTAVNEPAPGASDCHCTDGAAQFAGVEPAAVNVAAAGAVTVTPAGCVTIAGAAAHDGATYVYVSTELVAEVPVAGSVTVTSTLPAAPGGAVTVSEVPPDATVGFVPGFWEPKSTVSPAAKPVPSTVTRFPPMVGPVAGCTAVTVGGGPTIGIEAIVAAGLGAVQLIASVSPPAAPDATMPFAAVSSVRPTLEPEAPVTVYAPTDSGALGSSMTPGVPVVLTVTPGGAEANQLSDAGVAPAASTGTALRLRVRLPMPRPERVEYSEAGSVRPIWAVGAKLAFGASEAGATVATVAGIETVLPAAVHVSVTDDVYVVAPADAGTAASDSTPSPAASRIVRNPRVTLLGMNENNSPP